ncbi:hypothetical protein E2P81_ATG01926 [Venturia nashicola]|nr:hypothetical protein E2P81_ATG01926 [Venturia nashicola]
MIHFVTLILPLLAVRIQALTPPANNAEISTNEARTLPTVPKQLDSIPSPANNVPGISKNEALALPVAYEELGRRQLLGGFGGCGGALSRWAEVQAVFFPPIPRLIRVNMSETQTATLGFVHTFEGYRTRLTVQVRTPLWNQASGTYGTVVEAWNRADVGRRLIIIVEVSPRRGYQGPLLELRQSMDMDGGERYSRTRCMISTFGRNHRVQMYLWLEPL